MKYFLSLLQFVPVNGTFQQINFSIFLFFVTPIYRGANLLLEYVRQIPIASDLSTSRLQSPTPYWNNIYIFTSFIKCNEKYWWMGFVMSIYFSVFFEYIYLFKYENRKEKNISLCISVCECVSRECTAITLPTILRFRLRGAQRVKTDKKINWERCWY